MICRVQRIRETLRASLSSASQRDDAPWFRYLGLVLATTAVAFVWTVILPWVALQPQMANHLQELEKQGIDGGAMFYTELEAMEPILHKLESSPR